MSARRAMRDCSRSSRRRCKGSARCSSAPALQWRAGPARIRRRPPRRPRPLRRPFPRGGPHPSRREPRPLRHPFPRGGPRPSRREPRPLRRPFLRRELRRRILPCRAGTRSVPARSRAFVLRILLPSRDRDRSVPPAPRISSPSCSAAHGSSPAGRLREARPPRESRAGRTDSSI